MATRNTLNTAAATLGLACLLTLAGCDFEDDKSGGLVANHVTGSVGDGPIVGARLRVFANNGELLMEGKSSDTADYDIFIKTREKNYPLTLKADQGIDLVTGGPPDFTLVSGITSPNDRTTSNLNPYTTLIVSTARRWGTIDQSHVVFVRDAVLARYGFGLDSELVPEPTGTPIDEDNVHVVVKSSEAMGEMIRRTRDALNVTGANVDGDGVVEALAADLVDGWIDGAGSSGSDPRIAAVANVASAGVMVQFLANRLHVNGVDATEAMDNAIRQVRPNAPETNTTANVVITAEALEQTIAALAATAFLVEDERIGWTIEVLEDTEPGVLAADLAERLPEGIDSVLEAAVNEVALADDPTIATVNTISRSAPRSSGNELQPPPPPPALPPPSEPPPGSPAPPGTPGENTPPTISGAPDTTARVNVAWSFQPTARDADGDKLTFSVMNKPAWLSFDETTGRLWGKPTIEHVGSHLQIRISVSDGKASASLPAFDLVVEAPNGTATISWAAPTEREDGTNLTSVAKYKVYYGTSRSNLDQVATVSGTTTSHKVEGLAAGTWYFAVTATDGQGLESAKSAIGSKTIR